MTIGPHFDPLGQTESDRTVYSLKSCVHLRRPESDYPRLWDVR